MILNSPILLIETSTEQAVVGLVQAGSLLYEKHLPPGLHNSKYLAPAVQEGLDKTGVKLTELAYIAVGVGPGSYTGLRVGAMFAKALAFSHTIPLIGLCTLQCFIPEGEGLFSVLIDAKISGVYHINGMKHAEMIDHTTLPQIVALEHLALWLADKPRLVTPRAAILKEKLKHQFPEALWQERPPDLMQMARLSLREWEKGHYSRDSQLELLYMRQTQAELERIKNRSLSTPMER